MHVREVEHRPDEVHLRCDRETVVDRAQLVDAPHHLDAERDEPVFRLEPLAQVAELPDDVGDRAFPLAAEEEARVEDDESRARGLRETGGVVEHPECHLELLLACDVPEEGGEGRVHGERDVGGAQGLAEHGRSVVVEPEAAGEPDLAGAIAAGLEGLRALLERGRLRQPGRPDPDLRHAGTLDGCPSDAFSTLSAMANSPSRIDLLELDIDLRLADLWREAAEISEWNLDVVAAFMRAAYGKGYCDALTEDSPGSLCHDHGYRIPARRASAIEH